MDEFDNIANDQLKLYPKAVSTDVYNNILEKDDFQIVLSKEVIAQNAAVFTKSIPSLNVGLTESKTSRPLGDLDVKKDNFIKIRDRRTGPSVSPSPSGFTPDSTESNHLEKLRSLLDDVTQTIQEISEPPQNQYKQFQENKSSEISSQESMTSSQANSQNPSKVGIPSSYLSSLLSSSNT